MLIQEAIAAIEYEAQSVKNQRTDDFDRGYSYGLVWALRLLESKLKVYEAKNTKRG